jgi:putative membrane protein
VEGSAIFGFLIRLVINAAALAVAAWLIPGIRVDDLTALLVAALIFGIVNAVVKPFLAFVTCPLIVLTLGLFLLVLNAAMMGLTAWIAGQFDIGFHIDSFGDALLGAVIVAIVSWALTQLTD